MKRIPVIDLFAGPGGLGEGFSAYQNEAGQYPFKLSLSIEKDNFAHQTLRMRAFFREFERGQVPEEYYKFLKGCCKQEGLFRLFPKESASASNSAWKAELGVVDPKEVDKRIKHSLQNSETWILIGGPPCQAYSVVGRSRMSKVWERNPVEKDKDKRHYLYKEYLRIIENHRPPLFIMENVRGILSSSISSGKISDLIIDDLRKLKYRLYSFVTNFGEEIDKLHPEGFVIKCEDLGIPQARHRVIILGLRMDVKGYPELLDSKKVTALNNVIMDLPKIRSGISKDLDTEQKWLSVLRGMADNGLCGTDEVIQQEIKKQVTKLATGLSRGDEFIPEQLDGLEFERDWFYDPHLKGVCNHSSRSHMVEDIKRYFFVSCFAKIRNYSPKLCDFPPSLLPKHCNVSEGVAGTKFADRFRVQLAGRPCTTITSHISKDGHYFIHPDPVQCRSLTVREAARIQTFPDNYLFLGPRTSQYIQVGNAVPPLLARKLAGNVYKIFKDANLAD